MLKGPRHTRSTSGRVVGSPLFTLPFCSHTHDMHLYLSLPMLHLYYCRVMLCGLQAITTAMHAPTSASLAPEASKYADTVMFADGKRGASKGVDKKLQIKLKRCQAELTQCARIGGKRKLCHGKNGCGLIRPLIWFAEKDRPNTCIMCKAPSSKFIRLQESDWDAGTIGEMSCRNLAEDTSAIDSCIQQDIFIILCIGCVNGYLLALLLTHHLHQHFVCRALTVVYKRSPSQVQIHINSLA